MSARRSFQPGRLAPLALAVLGVLAVGSRASAGCGDQVRMDARHLDASLHGRLSVSIDPQAPLAEQDPSGPTPRRRCSGLSCSADPARPLTVLPSPSRLADQSLIVERLEPRDSDGSESVATGRTPTYPSPALDQAERPPRS